MTSFGKNAVAVEFVSKKKIGLHSSLLISAAASAIMFLGVVPAEATCTAPPTATCSGSLSAADFAGVNLPYNVTFVGTADLNSDVVVINTAADNGALVITTATGSMQASGGEFNSEGAYGGGTGPGTSTNTANIDNSGSFQSFYIGNDEESEAFTGLVTVTNESGGIIADTLNVYGTAGENFTNKGTVGSVSLDTAYLNATATPTHTNDATNSTDTSGSSHTNEGGPVTFDNANGGTVTGEVQLYGKGIAASNEGAMNDDIFIFGSDSWSQDSTTKTTAVFLDPTNTDTPQQTYVGNPDQYQSTTVTTTTAYGGDDSFTNTGTAAQDVNEYAAGKASLSNSGTIGGDVLVNTTEDFGNTAIATKVDTTTLTETNNGTTQDTATSDNYTVTPTGGDIVLSNATAGIISGDLSAYAAGDNTLTNDGAVNGDVTIDAENSSEVYSQTRDNSTSHSAPAPVVTVVTAPVAPPNTTTTTTVTSEINSRAGSGSGSDVFTSTGGTATLTNDATGVLGLKVTPVDVDVDGDTAAVFSNAAKGEVYGDVTVDSGPEVGSTSYSYAYSRTGGKLGPNDSGTDVEVNTDDGVHVSYESSDSDKTTSTFGRSHSDSHSSSDVYSAGSASLTNDGDITEDATADSSVTALIDNAGSIEGNVNVTNDDEDAYASSSSANSFSGTKTGDFEYTASYSGADFLQNYTTTTTFDGISTSSNSDSTSSSTIGATATLTNEATGTIGTDLSPVGVEVQGQASGTLTNDGSVFGDVNVSAGTGGEADAESDSTSAETKATHVTGISYDDGVPTDTMSQDSVEHIDSAQTSSADSVSYTGGNALLTNSDAALITGDVSVSAPAAVTVDNLGEIDGDVSVDGSSFLSESESSVENSSSDDLSTDAADVKASTAGAVTTTITAASTSLSNSSTSSASLSETESSSGSVATLINATTGTIGSATDPVTINVSGDTASITNSGGIEGDISMESISLAGTVSEASNETETEVGSTTSNITEVNNGVTDYDSSDKTTSSTAATDSGSLNYAVASSAVGGNASLTNSGSISHTAADGSIDIESIQAGTFSPVLESEVFDDSSSATASHDSEATLSGTTVSATITDTSATDVSTSEAGTSVLASVAVGGEASLTNNSGGTIGTAADQGDGDPYDVTVNGLTSSAVTNNGAIYGDVTIGQSKADFDTYFTTFDSEVADTKTTENDLQTTVVPGTPTVTSFDNKTTLVSSGDELDGDSFTASTVGGPASYTGSGTVVGSVDLYSVGNASATVTGHIGDPINGYGTFTVKSFGYALTGGKSEEDVTTANESSEDKSPDGKAETLTTNTNTTGVDTTKVSFGITSLGGTATLVNKGVIGGDAEKPMEVDVDGAAGASLLNNAHINGNVDVESNAFDLTFATDEVDTTSDVSSSVKNWADLTKVGAYFLSSTDTLNSEDVGTLSFDVTQVGGLAQATNTSNLTITGNLTVSGFAGAPVVNTGSIWGNVEADSEGANFFKTVTTDDKTGTVATLTPGKNIGDSTLVVSTTVADTSETKTGSMDAGGSATLTNSGSIGLKTVDTSGGIDITGGNVTLNADHNVAATNTITGVIYGNVTGSAEGTTIADDEITTANSTNVATTTTVATPPSTVTVTVFNGQTSDTDAYSATHTGGTATLQNTGTIGARFANSVKAGGGLSDAGGVFLDGDAGASISNTNVIGGDAEATSSVENEVYSRNDTSAESSTETSTGAATDFDTTTATNASTDTFTSAGGTATITNSSTGSIGATVLNGFSEPTDSDAEVIANGDAGASVSNAGMIAASDIDAISLSHNEVETSNDVTTTNYAGASLEFASSSETSSSSDVETPTGGVATITNTGSMTDGGGGLDVEADGYGGASVTNAAKALIAGDIFAYSYGNATSSTDAFTQTDLGVAGTDTLVERIENTTQNITYSGGNASVDNSGTIAFQVDAEAFGNATIKNEASGKIGGSILAYSVFENYALTATVDTVGPALSTATPTENDTFTDVETWTGGNASVDNFGSIGGEVTADAFKAASVTNEVGATIGEGVRENSLYEDGIETNTNGVVTEVATGGTSTFTNNGVVAEGLDIDSYAGSTVTNAAAASIDGDEYGSYIGTYSAAAQNTFTNAGVVGDVTDYYDNYIEFQGNTTATNTGIITEGLVFTQSDDSSAGSVATFNFGQGSVLEGDINNPYDVNNSYGGQNGLAALTVNFTNSGAYPYDIYNATATNKTGTGTWILTGDTYQLGATTISGGTLQFGTPNSAEADALLDSDAWEPYFGMNPLAGNTAISAGLNSVASGLSSGLIAAPAGTPVVTGNISIGSAGALEGDTIFLGNITNAGVYLAGYFVPDDASAPLGNLLDNTNQIAPGKDEISGNFTQTSTGTLATNFAPTVNRPERVLEGTQAGLFAPTTYWLSVAPFAPDATPSTMTVVDGAATVGGTVKVYVDKGGLYVGGDTRTIMESTGPLTVTAATSQSAPSLFVGFGLTETTSGGKNLLNVQVDRTSYASVATNAAAAAMGHALDSAVPAVASAIAANNFASVADFTNAQDLAGFLSDMDWQVGSASQANSILSAMSPGGWASLGAIDTGLGFRGQIMNHLTEQRGFSDDPDFGAWSQSYGLSQDVNKSGGSAGLNSNTYGTSLGWDTQIDNYVVGIAGGYGRTALGSGSSDFGGHITSYQIGAYGSASWGRWFADLDIWGNFGSGNVTRKLPALGRVGTAAVGTDEFRADGEVGYRFETDEGMGISPYGSLNYRDAHYGDITEKNLGGLGYTLKGVGGSFFSPDLGVTLDDKWQVSDALMVKPMIGAAVEFQSNPDSVTAQFLGGGNPFTVKSPAKNGVAFKPEAGINMPLGRALSMQIGYQGTYGGNVSSSGVWAGLRFTW